MQKWMDAKRCERDIFLNDNSLTGYIVLVYIEITLPIQLIGVIQRYYKTIKYDMYAHTVACTLSLNNI